MSCLIDEFAMRFGLVDKISLPKRPAGFTLLVKESTNVDETHDGRFVKINSKASFRLGDSMARNSGHHVYIIYVEYIDPSSTLKFGLLDATSPFSSTLGVSEKSVALVSPVYSVAPVSVPLDRPGILRSGDFLMMHVDTDEAVVTWYQLQPPMHHQQSTGSYLRPRAVPFSVLLQPTNLRPVKLASSRFPPTLKFSLPVLALDKDYEEGARVFLVSALRKASAKS
eukprot:TRINITY_DN637_c0_g4_i1.p1 TRINITY_DN637_c0_g4~~TRINITY_DN637_c0_g4_i1.p1  ORF type:complete len:225 (-),score=21.13 TRINITY_DN637_c0_g4_i1:107-781(-)